MPRVALSVMGGTLTLVALVGATWFLKPWSDLLALLEPTSTVTLTRTMVAPVTVPPTPTPGLSPTEARPTATPTMVVTATPSPVVSAPAASGTIPPATATLVQTEEVATPTAASAGGPLIHVVEAGDTLGGIAVRYDVSSDDIATANNIKKTTILQVGQELVIPLPTPEVTATAPATPASGSTRAASAPSSTASPTALPTRTATAAQQMVHVVQSGDVLERIASEYDVDVEDLAEANGITTETILQIGQELVVPQVSAVETTTGTAEPMATPTPAGAAASATVTAIPSLSATMAMTGTGAGDISLPARSPVAAMGASDTGSIEATSVATATLAVTVTQTITHVIETGDTLGSLAVRYQVNSQDIARANNISLNTTLQVGQELLIPDVVVTPTPEPSPTSSPQTTPNPTPTVTETLMPEPTPGPAYSYRQPQLLAPINGSAIEGRENAVLLNWTSVGILGEDEWYLLSLWRSEDAGEPARRVWTKATSYRVPPDLCPKGPPACHFLWQVGVVSHGEDVDSSVALSPPSSVYQFLWP